MNRIKKVLADLEVMPMTSKELLEVNPINQPSLSKTIKIMRNKKLIHISAWIKPPRQGGAAPVYALGDQPDAPRPKPQTTKERDRKYREVNRAILSIRRSGKRSPLAVWCQLMSKASRLSSRL